MENIFVHVSGRRLNAFREKKGLAQANFASLIGKSRQTVKFGSQKPV
jgi:DNA-binding XRE family transcriptional regulator